MGKWKGKREFDRLGFDCVFGRQRRTIEKSNVPEPKQRRHRNNKLHSTDEVVR